MSMPKEVCHEPEPLAADLSDGLRIAVVLGNVFVVIRHAFNLEPYYPDGSLWMAAHDWNCLLQRSINVFTAQAVPCFFLMSGFLFFHNVTQYSQIMRKWKGRVRSLLLPYFAWNAIWIFWGIIYCICNGGSFAARVRQLFSFIPFLKAFTIAPALGVFWYIRTLIVFVVCAPLIFWTFCKTPLSWLVVFLAARLWHAVDLGIFSSEGFFFFYLGGLCAYHHFEKWMPRVRSGRVLCIGWVCVMGIIVARILHPAVLVAWYAVVLFSVYWLLQTSAWLASRPAGKCLKSLKCHTLFIYALHIFSFVCLSHCIVLPLTPVCSFIIFIIRIAVGVSLPLGISVVVRRYFPRVHSFLIGGR